MTVFFSVRTLRWSRPIEFVDDLRVHCAAPVGRRSRTRAVGLLW
jgi:hypothetical protein